jgi:hypothetical protein
MGSPQLIKFGQADALGPFKRGNDGRLFFSRVVIRGGSVIESKAYMRNSRRNNFTVSVGSGEVMQVEGYFEQGGTVFAEVQLLDVAQASSAFAKTRPKIRRFTGGRKLVIKAEEISGDPLTCLTIGASFYVVDLPFSPEMY